MSVEIKYRVTEEDIYAFNDFHSKNSKTLQKTIRRHSFFWPFAFIVVGIIQQLVFQDTIGFILFIILGVLWGAFVPKYYYWWRRRMVKKLYSEGSNEGYIGDHSLTADGNGIKEISGLGQTILHWSAIKKIEMNENHGFIYLTAISAIVIPKKKVFFGDFNSFWNVVREKTGTAG
jgi:hypothetical protein